MWMHDMYTAVVGYIERRLIWYFFGRAVCAVGRIRTGIYRNILWFVFAFLFFFLSPFSKFLGHLRQAFLVLLLHRFNRYILLFFSFLVFMFFSRNTLVPAHGAKSTYHHCEHEFVKYIAARIRFHSIFRANIHSSCFFPSVVRQILSFFSLFIR